MKSKSTLILGGVFVLLGVIFLVTSYNPREKTKGAIPLFTDVVKPVIDKLEINSTKYPSLKVSEESALTVSI